MINRRVYLCVELLSHLRQLECRSSKVLPEPPPSLKMLRPPLQPPSGRKPGSDLWSSGDSRDSPLFLNALFIFILFGFFLLLLLHLLPVTAGGRSFPSAICCTNQQAFPSQAPPPFAFCSRGHLVAAEGQRSGGGPCVIRALLRCVGVGGVIKLSRSHD